MLAVIGNGIGFGRIDDHGTIVALLFLQAGMAVIPIGAALPQRKFIDEGRARFDPRETDAWHPIHLKGNDQAVPVNRAVLIERVLDVEAHILSFARSEEHTSELQSLMRISYAVFCLKKKKLNKHMIQHQ